MNVLKNRWSTGLVAWAMTLGIVACSSDDDAPSGGVFGDASAPDGGDGNGDGDGAGDDGGGSTRKATGETCESNEDCVSGLCFEGGSGGGTNASGNFCTFECTETGQDDPKCADPALSGKCNNRGFCQKKQR